MCHQSIQNYSYYLLEENFTWLYFLWTIFVIMKIIIERELIEFLIVENCKGNFNGVERICYNTDWRYSTRVKQRWKKFKSNIK